MTDEVTQSAPPTNGAGGTPEPSPGASPPAAAPAVSPEPAAAEPAPAAEPAAPAAEPAASEPTLLEKFDAEKAKTEPKAEEKPAEKPAEPKPEDKPAEPKPDGEKPAEPEEKPFEAVAYEYTLPETIKLDDASKAEFHTALDAFRKDPAKGAQSLVDMHNKAMTEYANGLYQKQVEAFNDTRRGWVTDVMADPEIGGAGYQTSMGAVARMRDLFLSHGRTESEAQAEHKVFNDFMKVTGAGDHPAFLRMLHTAARIFDEAAMPPPGPKPPANLGKPQGRGLRNIYKSNQGRQ